MKYCLKKKHVIRLNIILIVCILLMTSPITTMIGNSSKKTILKSEEYVNNTVISELTDDKYENLSYTFTFKEPNLRDIKIHKNVYSKITMPGTMAIGKEAGAPALPVKSVKILLPPQRQVKNIVIKDKPIEIETVDTTLKEKPIFPYQNPLPIGITTPKKLTVEKKIYNSLEKFPLRPYEKYQVGYCRGYTILSVTLNPVQYVPGKGELFHYPEMTVDIKLEEDKYINQFYRNNPDDESWIKKLVYNPEITESYQNMNPLRTEYSGGLCDPSDDYDYVIITTTYNDLDHWETTDTIPNNWSSLMDKHAIDDNLSCTLVTIQDIDACIDYHNSDSPVNDLPARIREFCRDAYGDWNTEYIFIGGDDEWISAREMDYAYELNVDSDLYWSNLDNTFNADHDSYWGEAGDAGFDLYSEIYIGRITCDTPQDVSNWMEKSFYYADSDNIDYLENAAFYGGEMGWPCEGDDFIDYSAIEGTSDWLGPSPGAHGSYPSWLGFRYGFETWNSEHSDLEYDLSVKWTAEPPNPGWMGGSESAAISGLRDAINNNHVTLISAIAHANADMSLDVHSSSWEASYHNTMPFFIHDMGCHCGDMDASADGVLHSMLFHSDTELAFACIYNTCYGWGSLADTNSSSALQQKLFWDYMLNINENSGSIHNWQLGKAMAFSKDTMAPTIDWTYPEAPGSWRAIIQGCLLFGDPAQRIKPPAEPETTLEYSIMCDWVDTDTGEHGPPKTEFVFGEECWSYSDIINTEQGDTITSEWKRNGEIRHTEEWTITEPWTSVWCYFYWTPDLTGNWQVDIKYNGEYLGSGPSFYVSMTGVIIGFDVDPNPVELAGTVTASVTGLNNGYEGEYYILGLYTAQHGYHSSGWVWLEPAETMQYQYIFENIAETTACQATMQYWNDDNPILHDEEEIIIDLIVPEHEIAVLDLDVPDILPNNQTTYVNSTICNGGINNESDIVVEFIINGSVEDTTIINTLDSGQSEIVSFIWTAADVGMQVVGIEAQPLPDETITTNNAFYKTVEVVPAPNILISPTEFNFNLNEGVTIVDTLTIGNEYDAEDNLTFNISYSDVEGWLSVVPEEGIVEVGTVFNLDVIVNTSYLDEGTYNINIIVNSNDFDEPEIHIPVDLTIMFENNVGVTSINYPPSEISAGNHTINTTIENFGSIDQDNVLVHCEIIENISSMFLIEDFSEVFLPSGWTQEQSGEWMQHIGNSAGGESPEAYLHAFNIVGNYAYLDSAPVYTTGVQSLTLEFKHFIDRLLINFNCRVLTRSSSTDSWTDVTPWSNPITDNVGPETVMINISDDIGPGTQVRFEFEGVYWFIDDWYIDDVKIYSESDPNPGNIVYQDDEIISISILSTEHVQFIPPWNALPGSYEIKVQTLLPDDQDPSNDQQNHSVSVIANNDVGVIFINGPTGLLEPGEYIVNSTVQNFGISDQIFSVNCSIYDEYDDLVYGTDMIADVAAGATEYVEFLPSWHATLAGEYRINITTMLEEDEDPRNDANETTVTIQEYTDVGVISINYPSEEMYSGLCTVNATIENFGNMDKDGVLVRCEIAENNYDILLEENFSEDFPPSGWTEDDWTQNDGNEAGGTSPEAQLHWRNISGQYAYLDSPSIDTSEATSLTLEFKHYIEHDIYSFNCRVYTRSSQSDFWTYVAPWWNPIESSIGPETVIIDISNDIGPATQVRFEFEGNKLNIVNWSLDDVRIYSESVFDPDDIIYEDDEIVSVSAFSNISVEFTPPWDALPGMYEIKVKTLLPTDQNPSNNQTVQSISVSTIPENDVGVISINYPLEDIYSGLCTVNASIENFGNNDQINVLVHCGINESIPSMFLDEDFSGPDFPPDGWTQDQPDEWVQLFGDSAGGISPEAYLFWYDVEDDGYASLDSTPVDTTEASSLTLEFKHYIDYQTYGNDIRVLARASESDTWADVTPWSNPVTGDIGPEIVLIDIISDVGPATQIRFELDGPSWMKNDWYIDDVKIYSEPGSIVYQSDEFVSVSAFSNVNVEFTPPWNAISGIYEIKVTTMLIGDESPDNDLSTKTVTVSESNWWSMFHHNPHKTGFSLTTAPNTNNTKWSYDLKGVFLESSPAVVDGRVYIGAKTAWNEYTVFCFDAETGEDPIWTHIISGTWVYSSYCSPAVVDGKIYIGSTNSRVYCLDAIGNSDGTTTEIWNYSTSGSIYSSPTVVDGYIYFGSHDRKIYCINADTGLEEWSYTTGERVTSSPAIVNSRVYIGSIDGKLYCLDATNGNYLWNFTTNDSISYSSPAVTDGRVYFGSWDNNVYCINASDGSFIWNFTTNGKVLSSPAVANGRVYIGSYDNRIYCLPQIDPNGDGIIETNEEIWNYTTESWVFSSPAVADNKVYVGSRDGTFYCYNADTGDSIWEYETIEEYPFDGIGSSPAIANGKVYIASTDGYLYVFEDVP